MATAIEALGMSLPYSSSTPANDPLKVAECKLAGDAVLNMLKKDIKPRDIMTKKAFENAVRIVMVTGGSTNAVVTPRTRWKLAESLAASLPCPRQYG